MNRQINILIDGSHLTKDRGTAGVQYEGNSTVLRIKFDETWDNLAKSVTWWNAKGLNPVVRVLTVDMLEDIQSSTRVYLCPIPAEPLTEAGMCTFVIDGFLDGKRQRSISDQLKVTAAPYAANAGATADPTPTQAEQLQAQIDAVVCDIRNAVIAADTSAEAMANASAAVAKANEALSLMASGNVVYVGMVPAAFGAAAVGDIEDIDTVTYSGLFRVIGNAGTFPPGVDNGIGIVINGYWDANYGEQIYLSFFTEKTYHRRRKSGVWGAWSIIVETEA